VNYDLRNWKLISAFLNGNKYTDISVLNRALLLDDALDLARVGLLPYEVALNVSSYLRHETHYLPWKAAFRNLDYIARMLHLTDGLAGYKVSYSRKTFAFGRAGAPCLASGHRWSRSTGVRNLEDCSLNNHCQEYLIICIR
jgi:hypothetical protein